MLDVDVLLVLVEDVLIEDVVEELVLVLEGVIVRS